MTTFLIITTVVLSGGLVYRWWVSQPRVADPIGCLDALMDPGGSSIAQPGVMRYRRARAEQHERDAQATGWLGEVKLQFNEVLEGQRRKVTAYGRARGWTQAQMRECMRRINGVYDEAMQEEVECAKRLFGETATREAVRRHDIAAR